MNVVDAAESFLVFGTLADVVEPRTGMVAGQIDTPTGLRFTRGIAGANVFNAWHVVEWPGITVQRGNYVNLSVADLTAVVPIETVDLDRTFVVVSAYTDSFEFGGNELMRSRLVNTDQLEFSVGGTGLPNVMAWQVITIPGARVTTIEGVLDASQLATDLAAPTDDSFAIVTWNAPDTIGGIGFGALTASIAEPNSVHLERQVSGAPLTFTCQVVRLPGARVQHG